MTNYLNKLKQEYKLDKEYEESVIEFKKAIVESSSLYSKYGDEYTIKLKEFNKNIEDILLKI
jgi:hypothetical protein